MNYICITYVIYKWHLHGFIYEILHLNHSNKSSNVSYSLFLFLLFYSIWLTFLSRAGLHPLDLEVGKWLRKHTPHIKPIVAMNKAESLSDGSGYLTSVAMEMWQLGFGNPIAISAETGLGMPDLYMSLRPLLEDYMLHVLNGK